MKRIQLSLYVLLLAGVMGLHRHCDCCVGSGS